MTDQQVAQLPGAEGAVPRCIVTDAGIEADQLRQPSRCVGLTPTT